MMVADSDVLIDFLEGRAPAASRIALELDTLVHVVEFASERGSSR